MVRYLTDLEEVDGTVWEGEVSTIGVNKVTCNNSMTVSLNTFNGGNKISTWNIPAGSKNFTTKLGLDNRTEDGVTALFQIYVDDSPVNSGYSVGVLTVKDVKVDLSGARRIKLVVRGTGNGGAGPGHVGDATWCDPRFAG
jgi:hypothetical protein